MYKTMVLVGYFVLSIKLLAAPQDTFILLKMLGTEIQSTAAIMKMLDIAKKNVERVEAAEAVVQKTRSVALNTDYMLFRVKSLPKRIKRLESISDLRDNMNSTRSVIRSGKRYSKDNLNIDITGDSDKGIEDLKKEEAYTYENMKKRQALLEMNYEWANSSNEKLREIGLSKLAAMNAMSVNNTNAELIRQGHIEKLQILQARLDKLEAQRVEFDKNKALGILPNICFEDYLQNNWSYPAVSDLKKNGNKVVCKSREG